MYRVMLAVVLVPLLISGLQAAGSSSERGKIVVVVSLPILEDFVEQVGGDRVEVQCLVPAGMDMHAYEASPADVARVASADVVVVNGLGLEAWIDKLISHSGFKGPVVVASNGSKILEGDGEEHHHHGHAHEGDGDEHDHHGNAHEGDGEHSVDPHAWMDVANAIHYVETIRDALTLQDREGTEQYDAWSSLYIAELRVLDAWVKRQVAQIPPEKRWIVTQHNALNYFCHAYGFKSESLTGLNSLEEPSANEFAKLVDALREKQIPAIFIESTLNSKTIDQLAGEAGVSVGGKLYVDSLPDAPNDHYIGLFKLNIRTLIQELK